MYLYKKEAEDLAHNAMERYSFGELDEIVKQIRVFMSNYLQGFNSIDYSKQISFNSSINNSIS